MITCPKCDTRNFNNAVNCTNCGSALNKVGDDTLEEAGRQVQSKIPDGQKREQAEKKHSQNQKESERPKTTKILLAVFWGGILGCVSLAFLAYLGGMWESFPFVGLFIGAPIGAVLGLVVYWLH